MADSDEPRLETLDTEITWGAYLRLSKLKSKKRRPGRRGRYRLPDESVQRQLALIRDHAAKRGLNLPEHLIFCDNGLSAWKPGEGKRPDWDKMIKAGRAGMFGGLLTWKISRFARNVRDGEDLLDLGVLLDGPTTETGRESMRIDLRTAQGKSVFRQQVECAANESEEKSEMVRTAFADMLAHGYRVGGGNGRLFGLEVLSETEIDWDWEAEDPDVEERITGPAIVVNASEAEVIRQWAAMLLANKTSQAMADYANDRGFTTPHGSKWSKAQVALTLRNPLYGGKLAYRGEIIGDLANSEAILDEETFNAVRAKLGARKQGRRPTGRYPLTGCLHCANPDCPKKGEGTLSGFTMAAKQGGGQRYVCAKSGGGCGKSVSAVPVEAIIREWVVDTSNDPDVQAKMRAADTALDKEREELAALLDGLDADIAEAEAKRARLPRSQTRTRAFHDRNIANMQARYEDAERMLAELGESSRRAPRVPPITAEKWDHPQVYTPADRADIIRRLGQRVSILPNPQGRPSRPFDPERVVGADGRPLT